MIFNAVIPTELIIQRALTLANKNTSFSFHWGHQKELNNYLLVGKSKSQINAFNDVDPVKNKTWKQYPLVWLVKPAMTYTTQEHGIYKIPKAKIVIAINSPELSKLNDVRERETFPKIEPIANNILSFFKRAQIVRFENQEKPIFGFDKLPNYSVSANQNENESIDIWDAILIEADLLINTNCINLETLKSDCREKI